MKTKIIYIRKENNINEHRTPIVPKDITQLINNGFNVYVESSSHRIYTDDEYEFYGAIITHNPWYDLLFNDALIVGIKEIPYIELLHKHTHIYFSHTYKNQIGCEKILHHFSKSSSILYDCEYFLDENNRRVISFGFYAGVVGCVLGIKQFLRKQTNDSNKTITNLQYWDNDGVMMEEIKNITNHYYENPIKIAIIGSMNGSCSNGVVTILEKMGISSYDFFDRKSDMMKLKSYDIVYNCILLNEEYDKIWFSKETVFENNIIIVDISCDYSKKNNPIQIYNTKTTWSNPVFSYNEKVDIIAIDNLPSLLPRNSSNYFSKKCVDLFTCNSSKKHWEKNKELYLDKTRDFV